MDLTVAAADGAQPAGVDRVGLERLPVEVVVELALVVTVQGATVEAVHGARDEPVRLPCPELVEGRAGRGVAQPGGALHVEPRGVEEHPHQLGRATLVDPQRQGEATCRVSGRHHAGVAVAFGDPLPGLVELGVVLRQVLHEVGRLVLAQGAAVLAEVERVERVASRGPPLGVLTMEEVVGEAVHVQDGAAGTLASGLAHQGCHDRTLGVVRQVDGLDLVGTDPARRSRARHGKSLAPASASSVRRATNSAATKPPWVPGLALRVSS